jgi:TRAP-type C4-dicarboxylate transport system permease small subunit
MNKLIDLLEKAVRAATILMIFGILVATLMQVIWRYVFNSPFMWTEELARDLGIWLVMLSVSVVLKEKRHLGFDIMPEKWKPALDLITNAAVLFFSISLFVSSIHFVQVSAGRESPAIRMPLWILYSALPVGLALLLIFAVHGSIRDIRALRKPRGDGK